MITKLTKHDHHRVKIHPTRGMGPHYAALRCCECNTHIQWLNHDQTQQLVELGCEINQPNIKE